MKVIKKLHLGKLTTFTLNRRLPIYNWFYFKEAFSRDLVFLFAESFGLGEGDLVLDPFCGTGTTLLACKQLGIDSIGYDVHPIMLFASRVKLKDYNVGELRAAVLKIMKAKFEKPKTEAPSFLTRFFAKPMLEDTCFFKQKIMEIDDEAVREFLLLGLINAAMECSWAYKDGAAIKVRKRRVRPLRRVLKRRLERMCADVEGFKTKVAKVKVEHCDARKLGLADESVDAVITSPPYLNKREYIYAYRIEQALLGLGTPAASELIGVREVGTREDFSEIRGFNDKPLEAKIYFQDMLASLRELYRVCKPRAKVALVTSDACFPSGVVEVCCTLSELAERAGFKAKRVLLVNRRFCTTSTRKKIGVTWEAILFWKK